MAARYRLGPGRRTANRIIRALLRLGLGPRRTYLLTVAGHRSGAPRSTPVTLVEDGGRRWLVSPYGEVAWVRNLRAARRAYFDARPESDLEQFRAEAPAHPVFTITSEP
jgi:hypothetical protein